MKLKKMTPEESAHYEKQKVKKCEDYTPPTEQDIKDMHEQEEENYYVSDMTTEEVAAFEKDLNEQYQQYLLDEDKANKKYAKFVDTGMKFSKGKSPGAKSKKRLHIEELVKNYPNRTAKELSRLANSELIGKMTFETFQNHVSKIKRDQK